MRFVKLGLISFVVLFIIATAISLLLPSTVIVSRDINFSVSADSTFAYFNDVNKWKEWIEIIDSSNSEVSLPSKGKGAFIVFNNSKAVIVESNKNQVKTTWQVKQGRIMKGEFNLINRSSANDYFTLQWTFTQELEWYPWEKFASILSDKALGPFMERSLDKLKIIIEKQGSVNHQ